jgi:hypothetical protein
MTEYIIKRSDELVAGDVVKSHGMRCQLGQVNVGHQVSEDNAARLAAAGFPTQVFWSIATILNVAEVDEAGVVPRGYRSGPNRDQWQIQGNAFARWSVEV